METATLHRANKLAEKIGHIQIATVGQDGMPHMTVAGKLSIDPEGLVEVTAWFCPMTVENLSMNRAISLVIWDPATDKGYQLLGMTERLEDLAYLDGYIPEQEDDVPIPQVMQKLVVRVDKILNFRRAPHSDIEAS
jgi:hypothetical protein